MKVSVNDFKEEREFLPSATPNCLQSWSTPKEFLCAPQDEMSVESYFRQLKQGAVYSKNRYGEQTVIKAELSTDKQRCFLMSYDPKAFKHWFVSEIYIENGNFIHNLYSSAFDEEGAEYHFCTVSGKEWDKPIPESTYAD